MRTVFLVFLLSGSLFAAEYPVSEIKLEARRDAINYDETEKIYFRENYTLKMNSTDNFSFSHYKILGNKENLITWRLVLNGVSPYWRFVFGHYNVNCGLGIGLGQRKYFSGDLYNPRSGLEFSKTIKPSNSANPLYSMRGLSVGFVKEWDVFSLSIYSFVSNRPRFYKNSDFDSAITSVEMSTIESKINPDSNYNQPVDINDAGLIVNCNFYDMFLVQSYYYTGGIFDSNGRRMMTGYRDNDMGWGSQMGYEVGGIFLKYWDEYVSIYTEIVSGKRNSQYRNGGYAFAGGFVYDYKLFMIKSIFSKSSDDYFAPLSADPSPPSEMYDLSVSIKPAKRVRIGVMASAENNNTPAGNFKYLKYARREGASAKYTSKPFSAECKFTYLNSDGADMKESYQTKANISTQKFYRKEIKAYSVWQNKSAYHLSYGGGMYFKHEIFDGIRYRTECAIYKISKGNSIYANAAVLPDSISTGSFISKSLLLAAVNLIADVQEFCKTSIRLEIKYSDGKITDHRIEGSLRIVF